MEPRDWAELGVFVLMAGGVLWRLAVSTSKFELIGKRQDEMRDTMQEFADDMKQQLNRINQLLLELTRFDGRVGRLEERQLAEGKRVDRIEEQIKRPPQPWRPKSGTAID